jgi:ribosomal subunit interface protein
MNISGVNLELTDAIETFAREKFGKAAKFVQGIEGLRCDIKLSRTNNHHNKGEVYMADASMQLPGQNIHVSAENSDLRGAIMEAEKQLVRQLKDYKDKENKKKFAERKDRRANKDITSMM